MASDLNFVEYIRDQLNGAGQISFKKCLVNMRSTVTKKSSRLFVKINYSSSQLLVGDL